MTEPSIMDAYDAAAPLHGYRGERSESAAVEFPLAPSISISREVGARGGEIARRLAGRLNWQLFDHERIDFASQDPAVADSIIDELPSGCREWVDQRLEQLKSTVLRANNSVVVRLARLILAMGAKGEAIFVGRGAGYLLPRSSTLHVRTVAPLDDRIAYMSQWLRLTAADAAEQVRVRSEKRHEFLSSCFRTLSNETLFDLVLNSSSLGESICTEIVATAIESKRRHDPLPDMKDEPA